MSIGSSTVMGSAENGGEQMERVTADKFLKKCYLEEKRNGLDWRKMETSKVFFFKDRRY